MTSRSSTLFKWSMLLGNLFEHYDTALFSLLSPFLAPLFFSNQHPLTALALTYCIIPLGMMARPIGSLFFGYIGDKRGRKEALILSLTGMAVVTGLMGFMPTYHQVGVLAPILLLMGRILQNFFAAGESMGGAIYLIENTPDPQQDLVSSFYGASTVAGFLLASLGVCILCSFNFIQEGWRLLYFLGCSTVLCTALLRGRNQQDLPLKEVASPFSMQLVLKACWTRRRALITIAVASGFSYASYMIALVMMNGFIPLVSSISKEEMMQLNTVLLALDFLLLPFFGFLAHQYSRQKMMMMSGLLAVLSGLPLFWFLENASFTAVVFIRFSLVMIGVWFSAPFHSWAQYLVPSSDRYTVISFAYAIGSQLIGGPTAAISLWLFQKTNWIVSAAWYWMLLGLLASYFIAKQEAFPEELQEASA